ncbi:TPA: hypothetical protein JBE16_02535 [Legionella pneumophila subsp. pneumophila]|uniref:SidE phosphodiesterase domain-containing protein n=1 Tax=Legionella sp. PATHC039 TaxID=2992042 RepID=UPI000778251B|nr:MULTISPECIES: SidE phosphodiesterase domain-containing protein [Legionella]HAT8857554.1 hypothetical protein [Legionella pneumophila subsp. pneumophila]MCW8394232.1 SidE phosphodiesterase domain-containing protein [Legionella sp. PATHC039]HAT8641740.1 hypothetical protein [Legionella pneumophila]HAT9651398.1 hypothetical protein [Legionella pneumophila subsp. pneumophila]HAT9919117.1 hypothetical protein [Legionella pneumophila subsp. pneumophila]
MKTLINRSRFLKAVEYISENHFSKPYSITPMVGRWFNQLAMIQLANSKLLHLSGDVARKYVDIILDGKIVAPEDLKLVHKFHASDSEFEKERAEIEAKILELTKAEKEAVESEKAEEIRKALEEQKENLKSFDSDKLKAKQLYDDIVARGQSILNEERLEGDFNSKIKHIVYRPNHGLTHSVRAAYSITAIHTFMQEQNSAYKELSEPELEKLQMMMLFSVVGRKDETGFNDTGANKLGRATYESFRVASGREYLKYCSDNAKHLYRDDLDKLYQDAIIVELMGYSNIKDCIDLRVSPPEVFIDYVIEKEKRVGNDISREQALTLIIKKRYSIANLFPVGPIRDLADAKLSMMNKAHGIDLTRCYPLYPAKEGGAKSVSILFSYLSQSGLFKTIDSAETAKLASAFNILRCSFDTLELTGQNSMFGLISREIFETKKEKIIKTLKEINEQFTPPISGENRIKLVSEAKSFIKELSLFWNLNSPSDETLLDYYRQFLLLQETVKYLTDTQKLNPSKKMFDFQHSEEGNPHKVDHHMNAVSLVNALETITPVPGLAQPPLPVIAKVKHDRPKNTTTAFFDDRQQAESFKETYTTLFGMTPDINSTGDGQFSIDVDRKNYLQLVKERQVEFKQVTAPKTISCEESLVGENGMVEALNLIERSRALVRLVSTTPLSGEKFPDYDYLLRALEDPVHERYKPPEKDIENFPIDKTKYSDPRSGVSYPRQVVTTPLPELRFQEPVTEPVRFTDKLSDGLTTGKPSGPRNTIYTKKLAHTLLPDHGKAKPFAGYKHKRSNYFPIGVLSDIEQVDLKDERYVWSQNMATCTKFWIRDTSKYEQNLYKLLHAQMDNTGKPIRYTTGVIAYDKSKIQKASSSDVLIKYLKDKADKVLKSLNNKHYHPTDEIIHDFKMLLRQELKEYLDQVSTDKQAQKQIKEIYSSLQEYLNQEAARKNPKYAISVRELIAQQKKSPEVRDHNEILAGNTKKATRALYACKDTLFDRLNLAFHAMQIKKQYHYDVPLLIISEDKPPYNYSEALIKADLKEAYNLLKDNRFPFDRSTFPVYELDKDGNIALDKNKKPIIKVNDLGREIQEPKNIKYQIGLLRDLFKLGLPELENLDQIKRGKIDKSEITEEQVDTAIDSIVEQMDIVGNIRREKKLMQETFAKPDQKPKEEFFLRAAALGHGSLVKEILKREDFKPSLPLVEKAMQFVEKNNHSELKESLTEYWGTLNSEFKELKSLIDQLESIKAHASETLAETQKKRIEIIINVINQTQILQKQINLPQEFTVLIQQKTLETLLNNASRKVKNENLVTKFKELLDKNYDLINPYAQILANNQMVKLDQLIEIYEELGIEHLLNTLTIIGARGWDAGNNYRLLVEFKEIKKAKQYLTDEDALHDKSLINIKEECGKLIRQIENAGLGKHDTATQYYCKAMRDMIEKGKDDYVMMSMNLQQLKQINSAVHSPEMQAIKEQVERLEKNAESLFSIGNRRKANRIKEAVAHVPLIERIHIFSNENSASCNKVRLALASHRISFTNPINESNRVISENAAKSFTEVERVANSSKSKEAIRLFYSKEKEEKNDDEIQINSPTLK